MLRRQRADKAAKIENIGARSIRVMVAGVISQRIGKLVEKTRDGGRCAM